MWSWRTKVGQPVIRAYIQMTLNPLFKDIPRSKYQIDSLSIMPALHGTQDIYGDSLPWNAAMSI